MLDGSYYKLYMLISTDIKSRIIVHLKDSLDHSFKFQHFVQKTIISLKEEFNLQNVTLLIHLLIFFFGVLYIFKNCKNSRKKKLYLHIGQKSIMFKRN
jgi:hypothetical protein